MKKLIEERLRELNRELKLLNYKSKGSNDELMTKIILESTITELRKILADDITRLRQKRGAKV